MAARSLEQLLLESRALSPVQIAIARRDAETRRRKLAPTLIDLGLIDEQRLAASIAQATNLPLLDPLPDAVVSALAGRVSRALAQEHQLVPVGLHGTELTIAMSDPFDAAAIAAVGAATGLVAHAVVARPREIARLLSLFFSDDQPPPEAAPFEFGSETLLSAQKQPFVIEEENFGSRTHVFTPRPSAPGEPSQLDRIEAQLTALTAAVASLERKLAAMDAALARVLTR